MTDAERAARIDDLTFRFRFDFGFTVEEAEEHAANVVAWSERLSFQHDVEADLAGLPVVGA